MKAPIFTELEAYKPSVGILYYPIGPCQDRNISHPMPDYQGWTSDRMARDLRRMKGAGLDFTVTVVHLDSMNDFFLQRMGDFVDMAGRLSGGTPKVVFCLTASNYDQRKMLKFMGWTIDSGLLDMKGYLRLDSKPLVILGPGMEPCTERHPALTFRRAFSGASEWAWSWQDDLPWSTSFGYDEQQAFVSAGRVSKDDNIRRGYRWSLPRKKGRTLRYGLWTAANKRTKIILISSWNDFKSGDFIEPNDYDQDHLYETLRRVLPSLSSK